MLWTGLALLCVQACAFAALWKRARGDAKWWRKMFRRAREIGAARHAELADLRAQLADTEKVCGELRQTRDKALVALREAAVELDAARAELAEARRELETARLDAQMRTRAHGEALSTAAVGRTEALARLKSIETLAREGREFLEK